MKVPKLLKDAPGWLFSMAITQVGGTGFSLCNVRCYVTLNAILA